MAEIKMSVPVKPDLHAKLCKLAKEDGRTLGRYVSKLLEAHAEKVKP